MGLKRGSWIFRHSHLFHDGVKVGVAAAADRLGGLPNLNALTPGHTVGVLIDDTSALHLLIDGEDQGAPTATGTTSTSDVDVFLIVILNLDERHIDRDRQMERRRHTD